MPGARTHDVITLLSGAALTPLAYQVLLRNGVPPEAALAGAGLYGGAHLLSGLYFSPDLDIDSAIDDRWGPLFWIWRPYMWLVPHRHLVLSHGLIISALLRMAYFLAVVMLLLTAIDFAAGLLEVVLPWSEPALRRYFIAWLREHPLATLCFMVGFVTGGDAHVIADWVYTHSKGLRRALGLRGGRSHRNHDRRYRGHRRYAAR
jgi:uncharacterized metal-binding protein